ncbi:hypothetical protein RO3G_01908 [Rhizopus delemar RA 99-880]|uniref:Uncharacterized protein n=1 Tax=Rhizopus delemar (strain RA 99-880 / ATCC MYA-4621 / FGSC 9543 / NRRL 43880) TaxID=246409 RepID=I1BLX4_RHIO9|nr:hypothetical protein RO3G_01908 [Rhizopus delemar RA 99-880]|eukprot:EIE77204.1 hypothetical protein RO3G_01908 [Rhizopus delemar RA 99-880]
MDPMCRYIRLAFATTTELWSSRLLLKTDHNESWFRTHVYSAVFDNAFIYDDKFTSKRADCHSNITKEFEDVDNQRVDFILRNINDDNDYLLAEEKSSLKGVKSDMKKGKALQKAMLRKWTGRLGSVEIMKQLEAITCQWQGLKLTERQLCSVQRRIPRGIICSCIGGRIIFEAIGVLKLYQA